MKTIFRTNNKSGNFTCITNSILQSETLSPDEVGVLVRLLSLPENFVIHKTLIWKTLNIGREHFNKVWNKLVVAGYIQTIKTIDNKSKHFVYTHTVHEIPIPRKLLKGSPITQPVVNQKPVPQEPVNGELVSLKTDNKKETGKNPEGKNNKEKENGEFGPSTGPDAGTKKENNVDTPTFLKFDVKPEELPLVESTSTISSPVSLNDIKKSKVLNLDFLKEVKDLLTFMDYEELLEHLNGEFQEYFGPLSQFEKYQLDVIVNSK